MNEKESCVQENFTQENYIQGNNVSPNDILQNAIQNNDIQNSDIQNNNIQSNKTYRDNGQKKDMERKTMQSQKTSADKETMRMEIESRSRNEEFARVVMAVFLSRLDPTLEEINDVKTAVSEAVTNAVIHGYEGGDGTIYIEASLSGQDFTVTVRDTGVGIGNISKAMEPMFTTDSTGERSGMGFAFMEAFMDKVEVWSELGRGTAVTMKKRIGR